MAIQLWAVTEIFETATYTAENKVAEIMILQMEEIILRTPSVVSPKQLCWEACHSDQQFHTCLTHSSRFRLNCATFAQ